ncbi:endonuclease IV [archaeon SCG-AAA382B04]|nr:endonuclease IV [archaeon SCG-AAA382B04]
MLKVGVHVSISGDLFRAIDREREIGGNCGQIFSHSPRGWSFTFPSNEEAKNFRRKYRNKDVNPFVIHEAYLPNLATPKDELYKKSLKATKKEVEVAKKLDIRYINIHPGTHTGLGESKGLKKIIRSLNKLETGDGVIILLETTSGSGTMLGYSFEQISKILNETTINTGVTLDTCHSFAAGYDLSSKKAVNETLDEFDSTVGLDNLELIHLNDSKHGLGSKKDRHEHIGLGKIGEEGMKSIINNERLRDLPFVLETPENSKRGDKENIQKVKEFRENYN